jgi:general secretion pathway protein D
MHLFRRDHCEMPSDCFARSVEGFGGSIVMHYVRTSAAFFHIFLLVGCAASQSILHKQSEASFGSPGAVESSVNNADFTPRFPAAANDGGANSNDTPAPMLFPGTTAYNPEERTASVEERTASGEDRTASIEPVMLRGDGVEMNFEGTDIASAAKTLLGDILHLNFQIDPHVQGSVTLASVGPIPRKDVLPTFESALRMQNAALVHDGSFVKIVPLADAAPHASVSVGTGEPGFGVSVVPLRYVSATTVAKTADNLLGRPDAIRVDAARNLVFVQGTTSERSTAIDVISTFDVEWLRNQSVGVYPLKSTSPESMIQELEKVFETNNGGPGQGVIQFQAVSRMNAVMVVTKNPDYLKETTRWVQRLDRADTTGTTVRTYRLKYGNASDVAKMLASIFGGQQSDGSDNSPVNQIAPGSTTAESRLDSLDRGSQTSNTAGQSASAIPNAAGNNATPISAAFEAFSGQKGTDAKGSQQASATTSGDALHGVLKNVRITADTVNNAVLVYSNQEDYRVIERALHDVDRPRLEVAIDATVAEVTLTSDLQFGVQYFLSNQNGSLGLFGVATQAATSAALQQVIPGFNLLLGSQSSPKVILNALSSVTDVKVLSSPSIVALDNQPAMLQVGDEIPVSTGTATILSSSNTPVVNQIELLNTGVILKVLPHVNANGSIQLEVDQEVSGVVNANNSTQQTLTPTISQRRIHSTVAVMSGQTVLLGGLISDNTQNTRSGIPGLSDIKILGALFGTTDSNKTRSEIIIFIRPQLIRNGVDARAVTEEFREKLQSMRGTRSVVTGEELIPPTK